VVNFNIMKGVKKLSGLFAFFIILTTPAVLAALPSTTNYQLNSYGFGSGGTANSGTSNYSLEGITGEVSGQTANTSNYQTKPGFNETQQANVPKVTLTNPSNYYDKLKFVIDQQNNPTDAKYALQISTSSNFSTGVNYVKNDNTIGPTLTLADYQTYATWGGASGANIIGLSSNTTYYLRAKATQGQFTESGYGPSTSAATVGQQISFCTYSTSGSCGGSNSVAFGGLTAGNITNSGTNIGVDFATNANSGGNVYIYSAFGGLNSAHASFTLTSATADLAVASSGYGAQIASVSQSSGGPLSKVSPYDLSANNIGILSTNVNTILTSSTPLVGDTAAIQLQAKPSNTTPAGGDYADTLTLIAAAAF
jgi:hypothetical protein